MAFILPSLSTYTLKYMDVLVIKTLGVGTID